MKTRTDQRAARRNALSVAMAGMAAMVVVGAMGALGGCAAPMERASVHGSWELGRAQRVGDGEALDGAGSGWALVMQTPRTTQLMAGADGRAMPEYARNDAALGAGRDGPLLATTEWPERERPDLYYPRRIQLETRGDEFLYFDTGARYSGYRYRSSRGAYEQGGTGTWGFWK